VNGSAFRTDNLARARIVYGRQTLPHQQIAAGDGKFSVWVL